MAWSGLPEASTHMHILCPALVKQHTWLCSSGDRQASYPQVPPPSVMMVEQEVVQEAVDLLLKHVQCPSSCTVCCSCLAPCRSIASWAPAVPLLLLCFGPCLQHQWMLSSYDLQLFNPSSALQITQCTLWDALDSFTLDQGHRHSTASGTQVAGACRSSGQKA